MCGGGGVGVCVGVGGGCLCGGGGVGVCVGGRCVIGDAMS